jgi:MFS family permease
MAGTRMAAPLLVLSLGYGKAAAGLLVALFALTQIFLSLPAGRFADRHGLKRPVGLSVIGATVGVALAAAWPVYPVLCIAALLCGGSVGAASVALQRHVGRMAQNPTELKQVFSWFAIAPAVSNFLGPFAAGLMIDYAGYRAAYGLLACLPMLSWLLLRRARELPSEETTAAHGGGAWDLLRDVSLRRLLLMGWFMNASWDLHGFMVPVLGHERGLPASVIGAILGGFAIAAAAIRVAMPIFARNLQEWAMITAATAFAGVLFLVYPLAPSALVMGLCSAGIGMALGAVQPMVMSMLHQITPRHRHGEAVAVRLIMVNISSVGMPMLFGAAGGLLGISGVFWVMGAVIGFGSRLGFGLRGVADAHEDR